MNLIELATPLIEQLRALQLKVQIAIQKKTKYEKHTRITNG
jgi:hypothetical protein